ncbi:hypothetical protein SLEP1_g2813 [Rubroshorea leprosula]|uniref:Cation/H+ exchanger domain-containing protein n=1 Tax=Rubroshorea leprosula TaxID=152421 RepID=A0AAV5HIT8_9ROSI|nr:hypothetical protein SLEP1_g2813 [Rubroshorea leprosula]
MIQLGAKTPPNTSSQGKYNVVHPYANELLICYLDNITISNNTWQIVNPLVKSLPIFFTQICPVIFLIRLFMLLLKPARQPRFMAELLTSILIGRSVLGLWSEASDALNPFEGAALVEVVANLGLTYYMFVVGLEMDLTPVWNSGKVAFYVALSGVVAPLLLGPFMVSLLRGSFKGEQEVPAEASLFWSIALTVTSFPDLARILSDLKLLHTDLGKMALTAAVMTDITSWALLVIAVSSINGQKKIFMILPTLAFIFVFWVVLRPFLSLVFRLTTSKTKEATFVEGRYSDTHVIFILAAVPLFGCLTDLCGSHSMIGAFLFGLIIPPGELGTKVMDKIEEYVVGIMLPPVFLTTGFRTNMGSMLTGYNPGLMCLAIIFNIFIKPLSTLLVSTFLGSSIRDSLALAVLMNTKGVLSIIILNEGRNLKGFDQQTFAAMVVSIFLMTGMVGPIVSLTYKSTRNAKRMLVRSLEKSRQDSELRLLLGVHSSTNVSSLLNILQISNAQRKSPVTVFAVHLVELTGRASAMLIFHDCRAPKTTLEGNNTGMTREKAEAEEIISAFESFERDNLAVSIQPLTAVSSYASMHEDMSNFALDKGVTLILLPFHKEPTADGGWKDDNLQHRQVNQNLLSSAPCSVGIFVDRGLNLNFAPQEESVSSSHHHHGLIMNNNVCRIGMLFIGGPDDREALAYAWRMAGCHQDHVTLTVVRFLQGEDMAELMPTESFSNGRDHPSGIFTAMMESEREQQLDADYINEFRFRTMYDKSITFIEKQVNSAEQTVSAVVNDHNDFDLYVVGRGEGFASPLTAGLSDWSEYPELGVIGEALISSEFVSQASVLVVQQSPPVRTNNGSKKNRVFLDQGSDQTFVNHRNKDDDY